MFFFSTRYYTKLPVWHINIVHQVDHILLDSIADRKTKEEQKNNNNITCAVWVMVKARPMTTIGLKIIIIYYYYYKSAGKRARETDAQCRVVDGIKYKYSRYK